MEECMRTLWISYYFLVIKASIDNPPANAAVNIGGSTTLNCSGDQIFNVWNFQAVNSTTIVSVVSRGCIPMNRPFCDYSGFSSTAIDCQLTIMNATSTCAGTYTCQDDGGTAVQRSAMVIVLESSTPNCTTNAKNDTYIDESTIVTMNCNVSYTTNPLLRPVLNWTQSSYTNYPTDSYAYSSIIVPNTIPRIPSDTCTLRFNPVVNPPAQTANNAPSYKSSCTVADVYPLYCPINVNITGAENGSSITNGNLLTCSADANPSVSHFEWLLNVCGTETTLDSIASTVPVYVPGSYVCNVTNDLPGCLNTSASLFITSVIPTTTLSTRTTHEISAGFWATSPSMDINTTDRLGAGGGSSNDGLIAVCVCLGISVTINIVMIVVMFRRQRIMKQNRTDDHVGSVNNRYCEEITPYENVAQPISIETSGYEHLNPSIVISPYQELANRHIN